MQFDENTIIERMKTLPDDLQSAIVSVDVANRVQKIGEKHGLLIDEIGALGDVSAYVMLGLIPGKKFASTLSERAGIDEKKATEIATDINNEVFKDIRGSLEKIEDEKVAGADANNENQSDLNKAGNMSVEKSLASEDVVSGVKKPLETISRTATLNALENPPAFVDHLLTGTVTSVSETVVKPAPIPDLQPPEASKPTAPATLPAPTPYKKDPYREPIE